MSNVYGLYYTYDSSYLGEDVRGIATLVDPRLTTSWDLIPEEEPSDKVNLDWWDANRYELGGTVRTNWNNTDTTGLTMDDDLAVIIQVGDVLKVDSEYLVVSVVTARGTGAGTFSVQARGHGSSSGASHTAGAEILIVGNANLEGAIGPDGLSEDTIKRTNYYSLVEEYIAVTKTAKEQKYEDIADKVDYERERAMTRALKKINRSVFYGIKNEGTKTASRSAGCLEEFVNSITYGAVRVNCSGAFTELKLQELLKNIALRGGAPNLILMSPKNKQIANGFNNSYIQTNRQDKQAGVIIDRYLDQNAGEVQFVSDPAMRDDVVFAINTNLMGKIWFKNDSLRFVEETNVSSRVYAETLQGQYTFRLKNCNTDYGALHSIT